MVTNPDSDSVLAAMTRDRADSIAKREAAAEENVAKMTLPLSYEDASKLDWYECDLLTKRETEWEPFNDPTPLVMNYNEDCKRCHGNRYWKPAIARGRTTGVLRYAEEKCRCNCVCRMAFFYYLERTVPLRYRNYRLADLKPSEKSRLSLPAQQRLYDLVREKPDDGYALFGGVGTSKTTLTTALYRYQLHKELKSMSEEDIYLSTICSQRRIPVWRLHANTLLLQHHDFAINRPTVNDKGEERGGAPEPDITREIIESFSKTGKRKCHIFLEEVDKVELSKFRRDVLFDLWDAGYENMAQMVINTNLTKDEFQNLFGAEFVRRIKESCTVIDLYSEEWK